MDETEKGWVVDPRLAKIHEERRYVHAAVSAHHLADAIQHRIRISWPGLPPDAFFMGAYFDTRSDSVLLRWGHETFSPTAAGEKIPTLLESTVEETLTMADEYGRWVFTRPADPPSVPC